MHYVDDKIGSVYFGSVTSITELYCFSIHNFFNSRDRCYYHDSLLKSLLGNSNFLTWLLIDWKKSHQPIQSNVRKWPSTKSNVDMDCVNTARNPMVLGQCFIKRVNFFIIFLSRELQTNNTNILLGDTVKIDTYMKMYKWWMIMWLKREIFYDNCTYIGWKPTRENSIWSNFPPRAWVRDLKVCMHMNHQWTYVTRIIHIYDEFYIFGVLHIIVSDISNIDERSQPGI